MIHIYFRFWNVFLFADQLLAANCTCFLWLTFYISVTASYYQRERIYWLQKIKHLKFRFRKIFLVSSFPYSVEGICIHMRTHICYSCCSANFIFGLHQALVKCYCSQEMWIQCKKKKKKIISFFLNLLTQNSWFTPAVIVFFHSLYIELICLASGHILTLIKYTIILISNGKHTNTSSILNHQLLKVSLSVCDL